MQQKLPKLRDEGRVGLLLVTHIDGDHNSGILGLLKDQEIGFRAKDVWFNGLPVSARRGAQHSWSLMPKKLMLAPCIVPARA